jgi:glycine cleavage system H protein
MADRNVPGDLKYTRDHEWVRVEGDTAIIGITDHAQCALGEVTYVELPSVGQAVTLGGELAVVESLKAASDVYAPLSGEVLEVNEGLEEAPGTVNEDCYGAGWLCKLQGVQADEIQKLLSPDRYGELLAQE